MTARAHSFTAKLAALDIGEALILADDRGDGSAPSRLERATHTVARVKAMEGRKFATRRLLAVDPASFEAFPVLQIRRLA